MSTSTIPALPCLCASMRRAARALTQLYEEELRPIGLRGSQFTILQVLHLMGKTTQGDLGRALAMDSTTLTRTLAIMQRQGWIQKQRGTDRREWRFRLSKSGEALLKRALPRWEAAQSRLRHQLGAGQWAELMKISDGLTAALTKQGEQK